MHLSAGYYLVERCELRDDNCVLAFFNNRLTFSMNPETVVTCTHGHFNQVVVAVNKYSHFCSHYMQLETILETLVDKMSHFHLAVVQVMRFVPVL